MTVDAHERLRRYLEQRRDQGESELVLDGMTVEDVLRIVGAKGAASAGAGTDRPPPPAARPAPPADRLAPPADRPALTPG